MFDKRRAAALNNVDANHVGKLATSPNYENTAKQGVAPKSCQQSRDLKANSVGIPAFTINSKVAYSKILIISKRNKKNEEKNSIKNSLKYF